MKIGKFFPSKYFKASDLPRPETFTISDCQLEFIGKDGVFSASVNDCPGQGRYPPSQTKR
jgi:hypothetical protein